MFTISSFLIFFTTTISIGWSFPFIFGPLLGLQFYIISEQKVFKLLKKLGGYSSLNRNEEPDGWVFGWPFIGYIYSTKSTYEEEKKELYLFTTKKFFSKKIKEIEIVNDFITEEEKTKPKIPTNINVYEREGSYSYIYYSKRIFNLDYFEPRENQSIIINNIIEIYEKKRCCVSILYGEKGTGKSMVSLLLAKELTKRYSKKNKENDENETFIKFSDTFKPTDPGDSFINLYNKASPTKNSPLIVVLEEFDTIVNDIHNNKILTHKNFHILIKDKPSWNQFFDRFDRKYFPWVILLLTTNVTPCSINDMDPSYIREGRVDSMYKLE